MVFPQLYMYALNKPMSGSRHSYDGLGGLTGADYHCYQQAQQQRLPGTYRAFLSSRVQDVKSVVNKDYHHLPVANAKVGTIVA